LKQIKNCFTCRFFPVSWGEDWELLPCGFTNGRYNVKAELRTSCKVSTHLNWQPRDSEVVANLLIKLTQGKLV